MTTDNTNSIKRNRLDAAFDYKADDEFKDQMLNAQAIELQYLRDEKQKMQENSVDLQKQISELTNQNKFLIDENKKLNDKFDNLLYKFEKLIKNKPQKNSKKNVVSEKITDSKTDTPTAGIDTHESERDKGESAVNQSEAVHNELNEKEQPTQSNDVVANTVHSVAADLMEVSTNETSNTTQDANTKENDKDDQSTSLIDLNSSTHSNDERFDDASDKHTETNVFLKNELFKRSNNVPPVDVYTNTNADDKTALIRLLKRNFDIKTFYCQTVNKSKLRIFTNGKDSRSNLITWLKERKYKFNTYTPADEKKINVLLKNADHIDDSSVIRANLAQSGILPCRVQPYVTGYMRKNKIKSKLWHIILEPGTDIKALFKIKYIEGAVVSFEFLKKKKAVQCRRCQLFNHTASNCQLEYRCVKCIEKHLPGQCKMDGTNKFTPKCVNCNGSHTANNLGECPYYKRIHDIRTDKKGSTVNTQNAAANKPEVKQQKKKVQPPKSLHQTQHEQLKQLKRQERQPKQHNKSKQQQKQLSQRNVHVSNNNNINRNDTTVHSDLFGKFESMLLSLQKQVANQNKIISKPANKNGS